MTQTETVMTKIGRVMQKGEHATSTKVLSELLSELLSSTAQDLNDSASRGNQIEVERLSGQVSLLRDLKSLLS